jgi:hypothetical protein
MGSSPNTMDRGSDMPYVERSKYYGYGVQYTMDMGIDIPLIRG